MQATVVLFYAPFFCMFLLPAFYALALALNDWPLAKKRSLLLGSVAFYAWGEPLFVIVVLVSAVVDYLVARRLHAEQSTRLRYALVSAGVISNLAILCFYKYADFISANLNILVRPLTGTEIPLLHLMLPIGISFVVFEKITYLVDTYRGTSEPASSFMDYALFVFFFPKLLAGPILKYHEMRSQIAEPASINWPDSRDGLSRFARGMAKKLLIADPIGSVTDQIFAVDPSHLDPVQAWLGALCFTLQVYLDFSAYTDMAIGLARMLGFQLKENFQMPYTARSVTEFWQRWNISLMTWFRDYFYASFGRNRRGPFRHYVNIWTWIIFITCGLWHGANWTFVIWGAYYALLITLERLFLGQWLRASGPVIATAATFIILMVGSVMFRSPTISAYGRLLDSTG